MADDQPNLTDKPRKRKINGSRKYHEKIQRLSSHTIGEDCKCTRYKCFENVNAAERQLLVTKFNEYPGKDAQDSYLSTLIYFQPVTRRRGRVDNPNYRAHTVDLKVKVPRNGEAVAVGVCQQGFCSMFGIKKNRLETIRNALAIKGHPPVDRRGKHNNRPHKLKDETRQAIRDHISSFRGRASHYSREKTRKLYLPEEMNISKMFELFKQHHRDVSITYETYRSIFNSDFNIGFGTPKKTHAQPAMNLL